MIGFNATFEMVDQLDKIVKKRGRGITRTAILEEAVAQYIEKEMNPDFAENLFLQAIQKNPDLVAEVAEAVHLYESRNPAKKPHGQ